MGLLKKDDNANAADTSKFEGEDAQVGTGDVTQAAASSGQVQGEGTQQVTQEAKADTTNPAGGDAKAGASATGAGSSGSVANTTRNALAESRAIRMDFMVSFENAMTVEYNTLNQIMATNGNFVDRESKKVLGDEVVFELLSYQSSYVVSPEDDKAPDDMVKYSNDGITCTDDAQTSVADHIAFLKANGYPDARRKERAVVVGAIQAAAKLSDEFVGKLVQFDLSPQSRTQWMRHIANASYGLKVKHYKEEDVVRVKAKTSLATKGTNTYTLVEFAVAV